LRDSLILQKFLKQKANPTVRQSAFVNAAIAIIFVAVLALITVGVAALLSPPPLPPEVTPLPTFVGELPTVTPTNTATSTPTSTATLPPTFTPRPSATATPTVSATATPPPSVTPLLPSQTPSPTWTPKPTSTPTETPIPFPFIAQGEPVFSANTANSLGCAWQGIGGQVFNAAGELPADAAVGLYARVISDQLDRRTRLGSNSLYGQNTGWEMALGSRSAEMLVYVRLETEDGRPQSPDVLVRFTGDCTANLARVNLTVNPRFAP
jgi:hypothetical protein